MPDQPNAAKQTDKSVENIPVPPMPQPVKSSSEILCELFGAFNATPPPLDDIKVPLEPVKKTHEKKHKKHKKKKSKKLKKKKDSSSSKSKNGESRKKPKKNKSKHSTSDSESVTSKKKKRKKLGKYSASDSDSDKDAPKIKKKKTSSEESSIKIKQTDVKMKPNIDYCNTIPNLIQENILKDAVSKIVDKVIDSTKLKKEPCDSEFDCERVSTSILGNKPEIIIKQEPSSPAKEQHLEPKCNEASTSSNEHALDNNIPIPEEKGSVEDLPVFKDDKQRNTESDKAKPLMGKIKIQNLKFSQVYEATVKQIEEAAKRKAEQYEEGELSETTSEEKSPTPSLHSSSESIVVVTYDKPLLKKKKHRHHRRCHHQKKRSKSKEEHSSYSRHKRRSNSQKLAEEDRERNKSRSQERSRRKRRMSIEMSRSQSRESSTDRTRERRRSRSRERSREKKKCRRRSTVSRERSNDRTRGRRSKDRSRSSDRVKERSTSPEKNKKEKERSMDRSNSRERSKDRTKESKKSKERASSKEKTKKISHGRSDHPSTRDKNKIIRGTEDKIDKQKLLEIARKNALSMMKGSGLVEQNKVVSITAGGKTVSELTDFCKLLSQKDAEGHESISSDTELSSGSESESRPFHHPFQLKDRNAPIVLNIRNSVALPVKSLQEKTAEQARELRLQFPVSSGQHHRKTESVWVPVTTKRPEPLAITAPPPPPPPAAPPVRRKRTFTDTPDPPMIEWQETRREVLETIGQFTGSTGVRVLTQAELAAGQQAWARRDQLQVAAPVNSGMGMALLQKMGWRPGEGLGKNKEGALQPLLLEVKMDKKGLVAQEELPTRQPHQIVRRTQRSLEGKHPVSLLNEYCSRRKFSPPCFELIDEAGPDHKKNFRFKVKVNGVEYTPAVGSPKKKQARAEAAEICLKELGILSMMK